MNIIIIGFSKIMYMPYLDLHLKKYCNGKNNVDLIVWNRDGRKDSEVKYEINNIYEFSEVLKSEKKMHKIKKFFSFKSFCLKILKNTEYDLIITLHTFPAFLLNNHLIKHYKNNYIFDYKDVTYEKYSMFRKVIQKLVLNSKYTLVSSEGYLKYLPKTNKIYISHNIDYKILEYRNKKSNKNEFIKISFWGVIRDFSINKKIIESVSKSNKIKLYYYGSDTECSKQLMHISEESENIYFKGSYFNDDRYAFAFETDMLHNAYDKNDINMSLAMSNKFYDGIIFYIPQICTEGTLMGQIVESNGLGIAVNFDDENFVDRIVAYYNNLNFEEFCDNCDTYLKKVLDENKKILDLM